MLFYGMNVLIISPGYPADMPEFTRGLAEAGARVFGVGDQHAGGLPDLVHLSEYVQVSSLWDSAKVIAELQRHLKGQQLDFIECLWEPGVMLAAELREHFGVAGMNVEHARLFRDKEAMKVALDKQATAWIKAWQAGQLTSKPDDAEITKLYEGH